MSIFSIDLSTFKQDFSIIEGNKKKMGEVHTDFNIIHKMLDLIPIKYLKNPNLKWLDPCAGRGFFSMALYKKLFSNLKNHFPDPIQRHNHIISKINLY